MKAFTIFAPRSGRIRSRNDLGARPTILVIDAPQVAAKEDAERIVRELALSAFGLDVTDGDSMRPGCIAWVHLIAQARFAKLALPSYCGGPQPVTETAE